MRLAVFVLALWPTTISAQFVGPRDAPSPRSTSGYRIDTRATTGGDAADIRERIRDGRRSGQLNRTDTRRARREVDQLDTLTQRYGAGGLSDAEARELQARALVLRDQVDTRRTQGFGGGSARQRGR